MKTSILATFAVLALVSGAEARPHRLPAASKVNTAEAEKVLAPLRQAATECFADTVLSNPKATAETQANDRLYGAKTGERYFKGAYVKHLDQQLAERLQPMFARKAVASAEPPVEKASAEDSAEGN